jgi:hypothetical protein
MEIKVNENNLLVIYVDESINGNYEPSIGMRYPSKGHWVNTITYKNGKMVSEQLEPIHEQRSNKGEEKSMVRILKVDKTK